MRVDELEANDLFEQTMLRGSQAGLEEQEIPQNIDALMLGMMGPSSTANAAVSDGPWNPSAYKSDLGGAAAQKRLKSKGKGKSRK